MRERLHTRALPTRSSGPSHAAAAALGYPDPPDALVVDCEARSASEVRLGQEHGLMVGSVQREDTKFAACAIVDTQPA